MRKEELKIVSGGQTGVDRAALQAAIDLGLDWGGWAPKGWGAEDGTIPQLHRERMQEHQYRNYLGRTRQNVLDSNATLIITDAYPLSSGTWRTYSFCEEAKRSLFVVSPDETDAVSKVQRWLGQFFTGGRSAPFVLNVAGPRESKSPGIQNRTYSFLAEVLHGILEVV